MPRPHYDTETRQAFSRFMTARAANSGLTTKEISELLGIHTSTFGGYKRGTAMPDVEMLKKICDVFDENYIIVACMFGYPDYRKPDYWLGPDYNKDSRYINLYNECFLGKTQAVKKIEENQEPEKKERKERKMAPSYAALLEFGKQLEAEETAAITDYCKNGTEAVAEAAETIGDDPEYTRMFDISESKEATEMLEHNGSIFSVVNDILVKDGISIGDSYDGKINSGFSVNGVQVVVDLTAEEIAEFIKTAVMSKVKKAMSAFMED